MSDAGSLAARQQSQRSIIRQLTDAHIRVWTIRQPCHLLVQFYCDRHGIWCWQPLECLNTSARGRPRREKDLKTRNEFLELTNTPVVASFNEAWAVLNTRHHPVHGP